jgi:hypothetical protein
MREERAHNSTEDYKVVVDDFGGGTWYTYGWLQASGRSSPPPGMLIHAQ